MADQQKGNVQHVCIYQCRPQADDPWYNLYEEIDADELDDYENTKNIVRGFMGNLEPKQYGDPSIKSARKHDFDTEATQATLNTLSTFHLGDDTSVDSAEKEDESGEDSGEEETEGDSEDEESFSDVSAPLVNGYIEAPNSVDCFLLFVEYIWESDRYESENRLMIVQLPLREDVFIPGEEDEGEGDAEELFSQLQDAFDDNLKKSVLYPYQEIPELEDDSSEEATDETDETSEDENADDDRLGVAYLYQGNGQAQYWYKYLDLQEEEHEDEILANQRIEIIRQLQDDDTDVEDIDDPFKEIDSLEDVDPDDLSDDIDQYWESGVVVEIGNVKIQGLTVGDVLGQDAIEFYESEETDEVFTVIRGQEPSFRPVGQGTYHQTGDEEDNDEAIDIPIFPELSEYKDLSQLIND
ncbi:hypothetical protein JZX76_09415 [Haloarcula hispanica]|uniref:Uncharacterized protein n=1 Tax=Haloarcula hispanica TaxID=51589 RepID=A0A482T347_HALHI|nr:hypothetical protein [Haloarcula hispanica]MCJ0619720.1 hypothetical protein [Haloarcula hispanica]RYJ10181.1 hypothetical protein ELS20_09335 [Haloarcula hispanica]